MGRRGHDMHEHLLKGWSLAWIGGGGFPDEYNHDNRIIVEAPN